jgi:hypothetical protein
MTTISHTQAFRQQADFAPESKLKVGNDIWTPETAGARLYAEVLSKKPSTVQKAIDLAAALDPPFTVKQVQGHLRWLYTAGQLTVDDKTYIVPAKAPKAKPEPKAKEVKVGKYAARLKAPKPEVKATATHQRRMVRTKRLKRAA